MEAFFYANHTTQGFDAVSDPGQHAVGALKLDAGIYLVFAKADIGTNVSSSPAYPQGGGMLTLTFGGSTDDSHVAVLPEAGANNENVALMVAAETTKSGAAVLRFQAVYRLRTFVNSVRLAALQLDGLHIDEVGREPSAADEEEDRSTLLRYALADPAAASLLSTFVRRTDED